MATTNSPNKTCDRAIDAAAEHFARQYKMSLGEARLQVRCALGHYALSQRSPVYPDQERRERIRSFVHGYTGENPDVQ